MVSVSNHGRTALRQAQRGEGEIWVIGDFAMMRGTPLTPP